MKQNPESLVVLFTNGSSEMTNNSNFHVIPAEDRWQIVRDGVLFAECQNKKFAITCGRKMAAKHGAALVIHPTLFLSPEISEQLRTA